MKKINVTDEWLYLYMPVVDEAIIRELENNTNLEYRFSKDFNKKMKRVIKKEEFPHLDIFYRIAKNAAVLLMCLLGSFLIVSMSVDAYRVKLFDTVKIIWEDSILHSYFTKGNPSKAVYYEPDYIPEGYQEAERASLDYWLSITYINENGDMITWDQMLIQDERQLIFDTEFDKQFTKVINGMSVVFSLYSDGYLHAYCEKDEYVYVLTADSISIEEACHILESITEK